MKAGRTRNACSILVSKARPVSPAHTSSPAGAAGLHGRPQRPCRQEAEQGEEGIRVVEAEHQDGDWREGERQGGKVRCHVPGPPPHQAVQDEDRGDAGGGLGQQHAPRGEPEDPGREDLHPQGGRRLVDGDEVAGVDRAEEERLPALCPRLDRRCVIRVAVADATEAPDVEHGGEDGDPSERQVGPCGMAKPVEASWPRWRVAGLRLGHDRGGFGQHAEVGGHGLNSLR